MCNLKLADTQNHRTAKWSFIIFCPHPHRYTCIATLEHKIRSNYCTQQAVVISAASELQKSDFRRMLSRTMFITRNHFLCLCAARIVGLGCGARLYNILMVEKIKLTKMLMVLCAVIAFTCTYCVWFGWKEDRFSVVLITEKELLRVDIYVCVYIILLTYFLVACGQSTTNFL